MAEIT